MREGSSAKALLALAAWNITSILQRAVLSYKESYVNEVTVVLGEHWGELMVVS